MTQKRVVRQNFPSERELAVKERLMKKLAEEKTKTETDSALKPLIEDITDTPEDETVKMAAEAQAAQAQAALIEEANREEERKRKLAERKKRRRQGGTKKADVSAADGKSADSDSDDSVVPVAKPPAAAAPAAKAAAPVQTTRTPARPPVVSAPAVAAVAAAAPAAVPKQGGRGGPKQGRQPELYVPRRSLAEEVEDAYVEQVCLQDRVGILSGTVSEMQTQMESIVSEVEKLQAENAAMERDLQEHQRMEKDVPNLHRRVESLRRELEALDHQQFRAKQEFELQSAKRLKPKEEELELACRALDSRRKDEADVSREERHVEDAKEDLENEKLKLREAISLYAVDPDLVSDEFWSLKAPEGLFNSDNFKKCEAQVLASFEKERKFQMKRVNDELGKFDKILKLINEDVMCFFLNNGAHAQYSDDAKQLVRRICLRSQDLHAPKPPSAQLAPPPPSAPPADHHSHRRDSHRDSHRDSRDFRRPRSSRPPRH